MDTQFDIVIIGAGPGGYVAAIRARQLGLSVAIVERDALGGVCLNMGCIPSKSLIHHAELVRSVPRLEALGITIDTSGLSYEKVFAASREAADTLSGGIAFLLRKNGVEVITGTARIAGIGEVDVDGATRLRASSIIVATGSRPREIPGLEFDGARVLSSNDALLLTELPRSLAILGGGAIGVEFAHIMNAFGVKVHVVEMLEHLLPNEDPEIAAILEKDLRDRGVQVSCATRVTDLRSSKDGVTLKLQGAGETDSEIAAEKLLVVVGRSANTADLGLEDVGVRVENGTIGVGDFSQTRVPGIYAIGDVVASPQLAHVASKEGEIAVEHIAGKNPRPRIDPLAIPSAVYAEPQVASFGYTEARAREAGVAFEIASFPYRGAGKSVAIERTQGLAKVLYDPASGEILGAHVAGAEATELIHEILLARTAELVPADIARMIHAHPTLSETVMELMRAADGWAIHG